ncbi:MAG: 50S ribosomal protein L29 [Clostridiaceae bacterium]|nr:50S ribosomal protein L29 [Clostridiaceae bacterium]MDD6274191.1 50S ribosomal protein L29 [Clostridiaceae bacterium]
MKTNEIREMSVEELNVKLNDLKKDLFNLRFQNATNQLENPKRITEVRRDIARVKTVITEKTAG